MGKSYRKILIGIAAAAKRWDEIGGPETDSALRKAVAELNTYEQDKAWELERGAQEAVEMMGSPFGCDG